MRFFTFLFLLLPFNFLIAQQAAIENVEFESDKYEITAERAIQLGQFANKMLQSADYSITLTGHTDSDGDHAYNENLSAHRSQAIKDFLIGQGLMAEQIHIANYGERQPMARNDIESGKQKNRRVEINYAHTPITDSKQLFAYFSKKQAQHFKGQSSEQQEITCQDGSVIIIPADAFTFQDGRPIGDVTYDLTVDEAIKASSMFQYRLNTAHADGSLSTGGMIKLTAKVGDEELLLQEGKSINISIPTAAVDPDMRMYKGERAENELMEWETIEEPISIMDVPPIKHEGVPFPAKLLTMMGEFDIEIPDYPGKLRDLSIPALLQKPMPATPKMDKPYKPGIPTRQIAKRPKNIIARIGYDVEAEQAKFDQRYAERMEVYEKRTKEYNDAMILFRENEKVYNAEMAIIDEQFAKDQKANFAERKETIDKYMETCYAHEVAALVAQKIDKFNKGLTAETIEEKLYPEDKILRTNFKFRISLKSLDYFARGESLPYGESADLFEYYREVLSRAAGLEKEIGFTKKLRKMQLAYKTYQHDNATEIKQKNAAVFASLDNNIKYYNFNITDPELYWCNIDTPTPFGTEFVQFQNSKFSELFTFRPVTKVVNYFPTNLKKQALYPTNQPVNYLAFKFGQQGLEMAQGEFRARGLDKINLNYQVATLQQIEQAMANLNG